MVNTAAVGSIEASVSAGMAGAAGRVAAVAVAGAGGDPPGAACPQANDPNRTHIKPLLRIKSVPPGFFHRFGEIVEQKILAQCRCARGCAETGQFRPPKLSTEGAHPAWFSQAGDFDFRFP